MQWDFSIHPDFFILHLNPCFSWRNVIPPFKRREEWYCSPPKGTNDGLRRSRGHHCFPSSNLLVVTWLTIKEIIPVKNYIIVTSVICHFQGKAIWQHIQELTWVKNLTFVIYVKRHFRKVIIWLSIRGFLLLVKSPINVI